MPRQERTYPVGKGADGNDYGVTRVQGVKKKTARKKPCATCPWRKDAEIGAFPPDAYRSSASTAYDGSLTTFSCHESGKDKPATCAGFLLANADNNLAVRMAMIEGTLNPEEIGNPENVALYESYRAMAIANGVDPNDHRIAPCRSNDEEWSDVRERMRRHDIQPTANAEDILRDALDKDHDMMMARKGGR